MESANAREYSYAGRAQILRRAAPEENSNTWAPGASASASAAAACSTVASVSARYGWRTNLARSGHAGPASSSRPARPARSAVCPISPLPAISGDYPHTE